MNSATNGAAHFFLQLAVILSVCAVMRAVMRRVGQTPVIGEMIAGVLLGPSLFGLLWPDAATFVFPAASKPILYSVASLGLTLYMFVVGLEFRSDLFREKIRTALAVSLKIRSVPLFQIYKGRELVASFATRDRKRVAEAINEAVGREVL